MENKPNSSSQQKGYNEQNPDEPHGAFDPAGKKMKKDSTKKPKQERVINAEKKAGKQKGDAE